MNYSSRHLPEDIALEVFALASRLYAEKNQGYSLSELIEAGTAAEIPAEFIERAVREIEAQRIRAKERQKRLKVIFASAAAAIALWGSWTYNSISSAAQRVNGAWAQVENQFQRRADLIPNLVNITRASAKQEREAVTLLTQSHQAYLQADTQSEKVKAIAEVSQAIERLRIYAAANPQVQSSEVFTNLQYELAGTENRIAVERMRYDQAVQDYNQTVQSFPNSLIAQPLGFKTKPFFQAGTKDSPKIN